MTAVPARTDLPAGYRPWPALWAMVIGFFMILVDSTIVSVATPAIMRGLDADVNAVIWVTSAYLLAYAVPLLITGRLGDRVGPKYVYLVGLALFTVSSLWCGLTVFALARVPWVRVLGLLYPAATLIVIVATANHFWLDAVGGLLCLAFGYAVAWAWYGRLPYALPRTVPAKTKSEAKAEAEESGSLPTKT